MAYQVGHRVTWRSRPVTGLHGAAGRLHGVAGELRLVVGGQREGGSVGAQEAGSRETRVWLVLGELVGQLRRGWC